MEYVSQPERDIKLYSVIIIFVVSEFGGCFALPQKSYTDLRPLYVPIVTRDGRKCQPAIPGRNLTCNIFLGDFGIAVGGSRSEIESKVKCFALYDSLYALCNLGMKFREIPVPDASDFCDEMPSTHTEIHHNNPAMKEWSHYAKQVLFDSKQCSEFCLNKNEVNETCQWIWTAHYILKNRNSFLITTKDPDPVKSQTPMSQTTPYKRTPNSTRSTNSFGINRGFKPGETPSRGIVEPNNDITVPAEANRTHEWIQFASSTDSKWYSNTYFLASSIVLLLFMVSILIFSRIKKASPTATDSVSMGSSQVLYSDSELLELLKIH